MRRAVNDNRKNIKGKAMLIIVLVLVAILGIMIYLTNDFNFKANNNINNNANINIYGENTNNNDNKNENNESVEDPEVYDLFYSYYDDAEELLSTMTLEEKVGQMFLVRFPVSGAIKEI